MSVTLLACSVAAAVIMIASAIKLENPIPDEGVNMDPVERTFTLIRRSLEYLARRQGPDVLGFL
jgi:hypothetical protein